MMNIIAIIPARGGSKRIPNKNIKLFAGKPMISYSISAAKDSGLFSHVVVSTDSDEVADVALKCGGEVPFRRPVELSNDFAGTDAVFLHGIQTCEALFGACQYACCIYATAPMLQPESIINGFEKLKASGAAAAFGVTSFAYPIFRAMREDERGRVVWQWPEYAATRSQDLPHMIHDAGQFYWVDAARFQATPDTIKDAAPVHLPQWTVQDIDTYEDWQKAEMMFAVSRNCKSNSL